MPLEYVERNAWHFSLALDATEENEQIRPAELGHFFGAIENLLPGQTNWAPVNPGFQVQVTPEGQVRPVSNIAACSSDLGWSLNASSMGLMLRHSQLAAGVNFDAPQALKGSRLLAPEQMPDSGQFIEIARRLVEAFPDSARRRVNRVELGAEYAAPTGDFDPGTWIGNHLLGWQELAYQPQANQRGVAVWHSYAYEAFGGRLQAWVDMLRRGNWFAHNGLLTRDSAVIFSCIARTAHPETHPCPSFEPEPIRPPRLGPQDIQIFLDLGANSVFARLLGRIYAHIPAGVEYRVR